MRKSDFDVIDTLLHELSESTSAVEANGALTSCRDTTTDKDCSCPSKAKPKPKKTRKFAAERRVLVKA